MGGSLTMKNGRIDKFLFGGGYAKASVASSTTDNFAFYFYDQDHLGNIHQVTEVDGSKTGNVIQKINYYPFGAQFCDGSTDSNVQSHKYNGKEFDKMHGLNTYDYGARQYNPVTARWDRMDPLAEKNPNVTPYHYCHDNPVSRIDPDGRDDYYNSEGIYLGTNGAKTDFVYIANEGQYKKLEDGRYVVNISSRVALNDAELDANAYSNIFTNCFRLGGGKCSELADGKIQVTVWQREGGSKFSNNHTEESSFEGDGVTSTSKDHANGAKTRSNINSTIIDHEFKGHYKDGLVHVEGVSDPIFKKQKESINWNNATQEYKDYFNKVIEEHGWK